VDETQIFILAIGVLVTAVGGYALFNATRHPRGSQKRMAGFVGGVGSLLLALVTFWIALM